MAWHDNPKALGVTLVTGTISTAGWPPEGGEEETQEGSALLAAVSCQVRGKLLQLNTAGA